jgi:hypothetical protein
VEACRWWLESGRPNKKKSRTSRCATILSISKTHLKNPDLKNPDLKNPDLKKD